MSNPFKGRQALAEALRQFKIDLMIQIGANPDLDVTGFTLAMNTDVPDSTIMYHKPAPGHDGHDLALMLCILQAMDTSGVNLDYKPLADAVAVIMATPQPEYLIFNYDHTAPDLQHKMFAVADLQALQSWHRKLGEIILKASGLEPAQAEKVPAPSSIIPFPTKH